MSHTTISAASSMASNWSIRIISNSSYMDLNYTNWTTIRDNIHKETPFYMTVLVSLIYLLVFLIGFVGNCLILHVVLTYGYMRSSTNLFLANLSVADMLVLTVCLPSGLAEFHLQEEWFLGDAMCRIIVFLENVAACASVLTIVAVSIDRAITVLQPLRARYICTPKRTAKTVVSVWITAIVTCLPFVVMAQEKMMSYYDGTIRPTCKTPIDNPWKKIYVVVLLVVFFLLPFCFLIVVYILIGQRLYIDIILKKSRNQHVISLMRSRRRAVIMLMSIVILFFVCLLPIRIFISLQSFGSLSVHLKLKTAEQYLWFINGCRILLYVNSAGNPVLCMIISRRFRRAFRSTLEHCFKFPGHQ